MYKIPKNDIDAWLFYPKYRFLYNKMQICQFQKILHAPMPIRPSQYPLVIKPITNLCGMGLDSFKVNNKKEFQEHWFHTGFWMEYFEGIHRSFDLFVINGVIKWWVCFKGIPLSTFGGFDYWETIDVELPDIVIELVKHISEFQGIVNIECIGDKIIECHLRMGDIKEIPDETIQLNIKNIYLGKEIVKIPIPKIYLIPIWGNRDYLKLLKTKFIKKRVGIFCKHLISYVIDSGKCANPPEQFRIMNLVSYSLDDGMEIRKRIFKLLQQHPLVYKKYFG